jgi:multidrug resistance efflux pump
MIDSSKPTFPASTPGSVRPNTATQLNRPLEKAPRSLLANLVLLVVSVGLLVAAFRLLHDKLTAVISKDAVINGTLIDMNSPIEGTVAELPATTGAVIGDQQPVFTLVNTKLIGRASQAKVQEIRSRLNELKMRLGSAEIELNRLESLKQAWVEEKGAQQQVQTGGLAPELRQAEEDLRSAQSQYRSADDIYQRLTTLRTEGGVALIEVTRAEIERERLANQVKAAEARIKTLQNDQRAALVGLSRARESGSYNPRFRLQDLETDAAKKRLEIQTLAQSVADAEAELTEAKADFEQAQLEQQRNQRSQVNAPMSGVIWQIEAKQGQFVEKGARLGQLLDCSRRWVDVFVDEEAVKSLRPGMPATIELYGKDSNTLKGQVSLIRSGVGRLQAGQDVAVPIAPNMPRTAQVRVNLEAASDRGTPDVMCYVGYTGKVSFQLQ